MKSSWVMETRSVLDIFRKLKCAQGLSTAALQGLSESSIRKRIPLGRNLWSMGDSGEFVAVILSGAIEIHKITTRGSETCMGIFGPSDAVGISAVIRKTQYPGTARSIARDTEVLKLFVRPLLNRRQHPAAEEISYWLRELLLTHEQILRDKIDILSSPRVEMKVAEVLGQMARRFGERRGRDGYFIPIALSKTQVSRLVDSRVETIIRLLGRWSKEHLVMFEKKGVLIVSLSDLESKAEAVS